MISGTLPSFMDYIMNLSAYKFNGENLVENAFKANKRIVFFGDDTWIHLLPKNLFHRYNGTTSFFATDYTEVDTNVTYCIDRELKRLEDWDLMISHYLGVDHIGHSHGGYHSRLMPKKLLEMDRVVQSVYESVSAADVSEPYLIVITGDHGMTDVGNHGGNTPEETDTALVFISTNNITVDLKKNKKVDHKTGRVLQVDISPTLSALLELPLPNKSRGKIMVNVLEAMNMSKTEQLCHMFENTIQISGLLTELSTQQKSLIRSAFDSHHKYVVKTKSGQDFRRAATDYNDLIGSIQMQLLTKFSEQSFLSLLSLSIIMAVLPVIGLIFMERHNSHSIVFTKLNLNIQSVFALTTLSLNCLFLLSTSFIETQHYFWYYMTSTFTLIYLTIAVRNYYRFEHKTIASLVDPFSSIRESYGLIKVMAIILVLVLLRVSNYWNLLFSFDIGQWLSGPDNKRVLSALVICSLIAISYLMSTKRFGKQQCLLISGLVWVYLYRWVHSLSINLRPNLLFCPIGATAGLLAHSKYRISYTLSAILEQR